ncbi:MAG: Gfo/Idh/MocA family oxidoreductase [Trueperaceae bacterium]|nr:Gfo/Idh/MocA family oxidoreductase [Trueperaceae bacterium]
MTTYTPKRLGVIGCGNISTAYFNATRTFPILDIVACADLNMEAAKKAAETWSIEAVSVDELLARDDIDIILNLTIPQAHASVTMQALKAGKHVHLEKPFALDRDEGQAVVDLATSTGLRVSCAPDTFLGGGIQTCRKLLDEGAIGKVVAGTAFMMCPGHESWHPNPGFYYAKGGGPVFDMATYYLTALITLIGPVKAVSSVAATTYPTRTITSELRKGEIIPVEVPTHVSSTLVFQNGAIITMVMSFDVHRHSNHPIELHGEKGSMQVPDPNTFGGDVALSMSRRDDWNKQELVNGYTDNMRGIGAADLAYALATGRPHRCHSDMAFHVLDVMQAMHEASESGTQVMIGSSCERPAPLPIGVAGGDLGD